MIKTPGSPSGLFGGRSSMVELQIVVLAVAGSSPVGHPNSRRDEIPRIELSQSLADGFKRDCESG